MYHWSSCWTFLIYFIFTLAPSLGNSDRENALRNMVKIFDMDTRHIRSERSTIEGVNQETRQLQEKLCGGMGPNNHACGLTRFDSRNQGRRDAELDDRGLNSDQQGTRAFVEGIQESPQSDKERIAYIAKLAKRRQDMDRILELLDEKENSIKQLRKRTCAVELGGACRSEWASAIADQYYYLMGPHGPGKRRRRSLIHVLQGKISHNSNTHRGL